jgi:hypothetical protein
MVLFLAVNMTAQKYLAVFVSLLVHSVHHYATMVEWETTNVHYYRTLCCAVDVDSEEE